MRRINIITSRDRERALILASKPYLPDHILSAFTQRFKKILYLSVAIDSHIPLEDFLSYDIHKIVLKGHSSIVGDEVEFIGDTDFPVAGAAFDPRIINDIEGVEIIEYHLSNIPWQGTIAINVNAVAYNNAFALPEHEFIVNSIFGEDNIPLMSNLRLGFGNGDMVTLCTTEVTLPQQMFGPPRTQIIHENILNLNIPGLDMCRKTSSLYQHSSFPLDTLEIQIPKDSFKKFMLLSSKYNVIGEITLIGQSGSCMLSSMEI